MPGTSENFEVNNLAGVSNRCVEPIRLLINHYSLESLVGFVKEGLPPEMVQDYQSLRDEEWRFILQNVIFSKITALKVDAYYSVEQLYFLIDLLGYCVMFKGTGRLLPKDLPKEYAHAQKWLNHAYAVLRLKKKVTNS
ncbi:conserved hypothetical protein [uncultured Thiomicrorhabdus sp.]